MHMYYSGRLEAVLKVYFLLLHFLLFFLLMIGVLYIIRIWIDVGNVYNIKIDTLRETERPSNREKWKNRDNLRWLILSVRLRDFGFEFFRGAIGINI